MKDCKKCNKAGKNCIPHLMTMTPEEMHVWCKARKAALHLTNEEIAEEANMPKRTVERIFSDSNTDSRFTSMQPIIRILSGCSEKELDCDQAQRTPNEVLLEQIKMKDAMIRHLEEETKRLNDHIAQLQANAQADMDRAKNEEAESLAYMKKKEKSHVRTIRALSVIIAVLLLLIITALIVDRLNSHIGFFWLEGLMHPGANKFTQWRT